MLLRPVCGFILLGSLLAGCQNTPPQTPPAAPAFTPAPAQTVPAQPARTASPGQAGFIRALPEYAFPATIDPGRRYLFYLPGKIIEDQGLPAVSPDFGEYEYLAILEELGKSGAVVISELRPKDTNPLEYAQKIAGQVQALLNAGVAGKNISVVGASKGAGIAVSISNLLENQAISYVLLAICAPDTVAEFIRNGVFLHGRVRSIYDFKDSLAGSCQDLFAFSAGKGTALVDEIVLQVGTGHGVLYKPLKEWIDPTLEWIGR